MTAIDAKLTYSVPAKIRPTFRTSKAKLTRAPRFRRESLTLHRRADHQKESHLGRERRVHLTAKSWQLRERSEQRHQAYQSDKTDRSLQAPPRDRRKEADPAGRAPYSFGWSNQASFAEFGDFAHP